jgi:hypothetical protein
MQYMSSLRETRSHSHEHPQQKWLQMASPSHCHTPFCSASMWTWGLLDCKKVLGSQGDVEMDHPSRLTGSKDLWTRTLLELPYVLQDTFHVLTGLLSYCSIQTLVLRSYTLLSFTSCYTLPSYDCYFLRLLYASLCAS